MGSDLLAQTKPSLVPTGEEDPPNQSTALLSFNTDSSSDDPSTKDYSGRRPTTTTVVFISLLLLTCIAFSAAFAFAFLFFSASSSASSSAIAHDLARPLKKLEKPVVLLISSDGFRFGYQFKTPTPNIHRLIANGTEAEMGLIPVFPTLTFPNHYSIVTGLYPAYHGIINNYFVDPHTGETFTMGSHEPKWWLGEPLWETVANHGLKAATYFWPGSEVKKGSWTCPEKLCMFYNGSVPFEERVDTVLSYFDLPSSEVPVFMTLYFEDPDHQGHEVGPDDPEITEAVAIIDRMIGRLIDGLEKRGESFTLRITVLTLSKLQSTMATISGLNLSTPKVLARMPDLGKPQLIKTSYLNQPSKRVSDFGSARVRARPVRAAPEGISEKVEESIKNAEALCADDPASGECVAAWDEVEELSAAASHARDKKKGSDPLEAYCKDNPETDECRTYED